MIFYFFCSRKTNEMVSLLLKTLLNKWLLTWNAWNKNGGSQKWNDSRGSLITRCKISYNPSIHLKLWEITFTPSFTQSLKRRRGGQISFCGNGQQTTLPTSTILPAEKLQLSCFCRSIVFHRFVNDWRRWLWKREGCLMLWQSII